MPGPWEKYQGTAEADGPWSKFTRDASGPPEPADAKFVGPKDEPQDNRSIIERYTGEKSVGGLLATGAKKAAGAVTDTVGGAYAEPRGGEMLGLLKEALLTGHENPAGREPVEIDKRGAQYLAPLVMGGGGSMMRAPGIRGSFSSASYADAAAPEAIGAANRETLRHALVEAMVKGYQGAETVGSAVKSAATAAPGLLLKGAKKIAPWAIGGGTFEGGRRIFSNLFH